MEVVLNYWSVLGAVAAAIVLGTVWYGPLFGKQWMRIVGTTMGEMTHAAIRVYELMPNRRANNHCMIAGLTWKMRPSE